MSWIRTLLHRTGLHPSPSLALRDARLLDALGDGLVPPGLRDLERPASRLMQLGPDGQLEIVPRDEEP